jgi:predicted Zn-dependent peptidase
MMEQVFNSKEHILENGLKLVSIHKDTEISSIHVGVNVGAINEDFEEKGICHFIEHMLFKGTELRDNSKIDQDFEDRAGSYNAYTTYTATVFAITALCEELEASVELLSDIIINSTFPVHEIEKERGVILAEIRNSTDDIEHYSFNMTNNIAFSNSPLKYDIVGTEKTVKKLTKKHLEEFYKAHYVPNNCVISIVSSFSHEEVKEMVEKYFDSWKSKTVVEKPVIIEKNRHVEKTTYRKDIEQNTLVYLYTFYGLNRDEELALEILNHKFGESANSILFRALREDKGLAYDVYSEMDVTDWIKTLYIYTAVGENDVAEAKETIDKCISGIINREIIIDDRNILLMKKVMKTGIASMLEDSEGLCNYVLHQKLIGKNIYAFNEDMKALDHISGNEVYEVAKMVLDSPTVHILVNSKKQ